MGLQELTIIRNTPINFRLTTKDAGFIAERDKIFKQLKLANRNLNDKKDFLTALLMNLKLNMRLDWPGRPYYVSISRDKNYYSSIPARYKLNSVSYENVVQVLDEMIRLDYIEQKIGYWAKNKHKKGLRTIIRAKDSLKQILSKHNNFPIIHERPKEFIILRDKDNNDIDYTDTVKTNLMRDVLRKYSDLRMGTEIKLKQIPAELYNEWLQLLIPFLKSAAKKQPATGLIDVEIHPAFLVRIFNIDFQHGGRFYRGVESVVPQEIRKYFAFNDKPTVELDYSGLHLRMLYNENKVNIRKDPYTIDKSGNPYLRNVLKIMSLTMINAADKTAAIKSIRLEMQNELLYYNILPDVKHKTIETLCDKFVKAHKPIEKYFFSGEGVRLQNVDSNITNDIVNYFTGKGIFIMVIHDSYIIDAEYENDLLAYMKFAYHRYLKFYPKIGKK